MWTHLWRISKTLTSAHQKSPDPLWKCILRPTLLGILSLFRPEPSLPLGVCVCVNLNTYDSINLYGYDCTYAVRILVNGRVIAVISMCVCVCAFERVVVKCVSPGMTPRPSFFSLANFT